MLAAGLDAVTVCTPHTAHAEGVLAAARHGVHVLCEKPIAVSLDEADRMVEATAQAGVLFGVLFQRRFWPAAARIRRAIDDGRLGPPISGGVVARFNRDAAYYAEPWRGRWDTEGGGVLMTQAIHHIDLLQWFMGPATRVTGRYATLAHQDFIEVEDTVGAIVEFASGGVATIQAGTTFDPGLGAQVWVSDARGPHGERDGVPGGRRLHRSVDGARRGGVSPRSTAPAVDVRHSRWRRSTGTSCPTTRCRSRTSSTPCAPVASRR